MDEPAEEGVRYLGPPCDSRGMIVKHKLNVGFAESLAAMTDYQFFTPAVLYLHGAFTDGPLIDFMFNEQRDIRLHYHVSRTKIFNGLEAPSNGNVLWNHALWAVAKEEVGGKSILEKVACLLWGMRSAGASAIRC